MVTIETDAVFHPYIEELRFLGKIFMQIYFGRDQNQQSSAALSEV